MLRFLLLLPFLASAVEVPAVVQSVHDGDTITVQAGGQVERVRLLLIDTPEVTDNKHGQRMAEGEAARDLVRALLPAGARVVLWGPGVELERDQHKRLLAVVRLGDTTIQEEVIAAGWSPLWEKYGRAPEGYRVRWQEAENQARAAGRGAWSTAPDYMRDKANETTAKGR